MPTDFDPKPVEESEDTPGVDVPYPGELRDAEHYLKHPSDRMSTQLPDVDNLLVCFDTEASGLFVDEGARVSVVSLAWYDEHDEIERRVFPFDQGVLDKPNTGGLSAGLFDGAPNLGKDEWDDLCHWLLRQSLTAHNIKYDLHIMRAGHRVWGEGVDLSNRIKWCTLVTSGICFPTQSIALKSIAKGLWGEDEGEPERRLKKWLAKHKVKDRFGKSQPRYDLAPWDLIGPYASLDADQGIRLHQHQMAMIEQGEVAESFAILDRAVDLALCLFRMECRGVGFSRERCEAAAAELRRERDKLRRQLIQDWGREPTPDAARWWFFSKQACEIIEKTEGGKASVAQEIVGELVLRGIPGAHEYEQLAAYNSALTKWYDGWPALLGPDGRLRPNYHQTKEGGEYGSGRGTISGRLSVERVQLQAIPHDFRLPQGVPSVRSMFEAKPGHELWEIDISQAEVRVGTHVAQCEPMRQILLAGDDVHGATAIRVFGATPGMPGWDRIRTLAKRATFANIYGAGPETFQRTLKEQAGIIISLAEAREYLQEYQSMFPEFRDLYFRSIQQVKAMGYITLVTGRRRWFSQHERITRPSKGMNQKIQGNVAEAMNIAKIEVEYEYPGCLLNEVHDSLMLELVQGDEGAAKARLIADLMLCVLEDLFPGWDCEHKIPWKVDTKKWH